MSVSEWVSQSASLSHKTSWTLYRSQSSTDLHQTCHQGRVPGDVVTYCFWWKSEVFLVAKPEVELILTNTPMEKYLSCQISQNGDRYGTGVNGSWIGNQPWAINWYHDLWPWTVLNLGHKIFASNISNTVRENVGHDAGQIGNHQRTFDWNHDLWLWMTLNHPSICNATALGRYRFNRMYFLLFF